MHKPHARFPTQAQLCFPILEVLAEAGTPMQAADVVGAVADRFEIPAAHRTEVAIIAADGQRTQLWGRHVRFARQKLVSRGLLTSPKHGLWALTEDGAAGVAEAQAGVAVRVWVTPKGTPIFAQVETVVTLPTIHTCVESDSRDLSWIGSDSVQLACTSPPYFDLKEYGAVEGQLGNMTDFRSFLDELDRVWAECFRVLVPGGRLAVNAGDVARSRRRHGRHRILPLHAHILVRGEALGFEVLNGIIWHKRSNVTSESGGRAMLGRPYQPNAIIPLETEHILMFRKPAAYRTPTAAQQIASRLDPARHHSVYRAIWSDLPGASTKRGHPAPFPIELPLRVIEMCSYAGDTVLDPFAGRFHTAIAALRSGRNSVGIDVVRGNVEAGVAHLMREAEALVAA